MAKKSGKGPDDKVDQGSTKPFMKEVKNMGETRGLRDGKKSSGKKMKKGC